MLLQFLIKLFDFPLTHCCCNVQNVDEDTVYWQQHLGFIKRNRALFGGLDSWWKIQTFDNISIAFQSNAAPKTTDWIRTFVQRMKKMKLPRSFSLWIFKHEKTFSSVWKSLGEHTASSADLTSRIRSMIDHLESAERYSEIHPFKCINLCIYTSECKYFFRWNESRGN